MTDEHHSEHLQWIANCCDNQCVHGDLIMAFDTQEPRNEWARLHRKKLNHKVLCYQQKVKVTPDD